MPVNRLVEAPHAAAKLAGLRAFQMIEGVWPDPPVEIGDIILVNPTAGTISGKPSVVRKNSNDYMLADDLHSIKPPDVVGPVVGVMKKFPKPF